MLFICIFLFHIAVSAACWTNKYCKHDAVSYVKRDSCNYCYYYYYSYLLQLNFHSVAVAITLVQAKQIIYIHETIKNTVQTIQNTVQTIQNTVYEIDRFWAINFVENIFSFSDAALKLNNITLLIRSSDISAITDHLLDVQCSESRTS